MTEWIKAEQVSGLLEPGMTVFVASATAEPREILQALSQQGDCCAGVRFVSVSLPGVNNVDFSTFHPQTRATAFFATARNRASMAAGQVDFIPLQYRAIYDYLASGLDIDVALVQLPPFETDQPVSMGISADFLPGVLDNARLVIGEINTRQPVPQDAPAMPQSRLDYALECDRPVPVVPEPAANEANDEIGRLIAGLIEDGSCIQAGLGAVPNAALAALAEKNDLGCHSGMISDGVMELAKAGNITGLYKTVDKGKIVTGATLGSDALIEWAGSAPELMIRPVSYTHDPGVISRIDHFVSINTALEVDLFGQVNAESIGGRQVSGPGGSVDMMRGAALSKGGKSIIALNATAAGGKVSRIVAALGPATAATTLRSDIDYVVTEFGARRIRHLPVETRAQALIEIAHPDFRDRLRDEWNEMVRA